MRLSRFVCTACILAIVATAVLPRLSAQEQNSANQSIVEEWDSLMKQREQFNEQAGQLQKAFQQADKAGQQKLRSQFQQMIQNFEQNLLPRMIELAPQVYKQDPKKFEAGELTAEIAYRSNDYDRAAEVGKQLIDAGHRSGQVLNVAGASEFARHNFKRADELLQEAEKEQVLDPRVGGAFLEAAGRYIDFWQKEQQIRQQEQQATGDKALPQVELTTSRGKITLELFENQAPNTVANFISLIENNTYDGTTFHRVIRNFMVQGGDPNSKDNNPSNDGQGGPGYNIACECYRDDARKHFRGSLSMAHGTDKDTGGSQFFITHVPTHWLNTDTAEAGHTVFGRVLEGMDVVDAIEKGDELVSARVIRKRDHAYEPKTLPAS